jgi:hypothetical protein
LTCLALFPVRAQQASPAPPSSDPICGFITGPHFYYEASQVKEGLAVDLLVGNAGAHQPITLRFFVNQKPKGFPVDRLQVEHEKLLHVLGVRDDLSEFFHLHPLKVGPGLWEVTHTFARGGTYKIWSDMKWRGTSYSFGHPLLTVSENPDRNGQPASSPDMAASTAGFSLDLISKGPFIAPGTNQLEFLIRNAAGKTPDLENFLGTPLHLVLIKNDLSVYLHAHPEPRRPGEFVIRFNQVFEKPGAYKLFAQFRPREARLSAGSALLAEHLVTVTADRR